MALTEKQRGVLAGMAVGATATVAGIFAAAWWQPPALVPADSPLGRAAFVAAWDLLVVFWLLAGIGTLARHRFFTPQDIDGAGLGANSDRAHVLQSVLQNTLEQTVLAIAVHAAWAALMPVGLLAVIPVAAVLFFAGRLLFVLGYAKGAPHRAAGFAATFYPSVLMFAILAVALATGHAGG